MAARRVGAADRRARVAVVASVAEDRATRAGLGGWVGRRRAGDGLSDGHVIRCGCLPRSRHRREPDARRGGHQSGRHRLLYEERHARSPGGAFQRRKLGRRAHQLGRFEQPVVLLHAAEPRLGRGLRVRQHRRSRQSLDQERQGRRPHEPRQSPARRDERQGVGSRLRVHLHGRQGCRDGRRDAEPHAGDQLRHYPQRSSLRRRLRRPSAEHRRISSA